MLVEILVAIGVGIACGVITGLTPGLHINLVAAMIISYSALILQHVNSLFVVIFLIALSVTHTFLDMIPSIFLGAPQEATALGVLPGHRFLLRGEGMVALKLSVLGSLGAIIISIMLFPLLLIVIKGYVFIQPYIGFVLIGVAAIMILTEKRRTWALFVFCVAGLLGLIALNMPNLENPLLPMLSGMFGISTLIISLNKTQSIAPQKIQQEVRIDKATTIKALVSGQLSGFVTAVFPGLSSSIAAIMSMQAIRKLKEEGFMMLIGCIGTANFVISMATLIAVGKARNGSIVAIQKLMPTINATTLLAGIATMLISAGISVVLALEIGKMFSRIIGKVNYRKLLLGIICFVTMLVAFVTGWIGVLVLVISTSIGIIPAITKVSRTQSMGCLLLPVIISYF
ncbi:MAG: tripartite tricarboxylate transporter permease [Candidatus Woesearchaeota archaeon]